VPVVFELEQIERRDEAIGRVASNDVQFAGLKGATSA